MRYRVIDRFCADSYHRTERAARAALAELISSRGPSRLRLVEHDATGTGLWLPLDSAEERAQIERETDAEIAAALDEEGV